MASGIGHFAGSADSVAVAGATSGPLLLASVACPPVSGLQAAKANDSAKKVDFNGMLMTVFG